MAHGLHNMQQTLCPGFQVASTSTNTQTNKEIVHEDESGMETKVPTINTVICGF